MPLAMDFGTCNTVLARWQPSSRQVKTLQIGGPTRIYNYLIPGTQKRQLSAVIPSLIHYGSRVDIAHAGKTIGAQVENVGLATDRGTFRWMKLDLLKGNNRARRINGQLITPRQAAESFIEQVLFAAAGNEDEDLVITLPIESFDHYANWLQNTTSRVFPGRIRMLDEATACILGYGTRVREGQVYIVFDFGGGTLDISVVKILELDADQTRPCIVLGRSGEEIGGALVDQWLLKELAQAQGLNSDTIGAIGSDLLHAIENAKVKLSDGIEQVKVEHFDGAKRISHTFSVTDLRHVLEADRVSLGNRNFYRLISLTLERALTQAQERYATKRSDIRAVFMVGGSSLLLGVADLVKNLLPDCPVHCENPFEAIARGACRYAGGNINLTLVHDYCLRAWDSERSEYSLIPIIPKGTHYPTERPISIKYINGACEGSEYLSLVVIERSEMVRPEGLWEIIGGRLQRRTTDWHTDNALKELNPADREFIHANPSCIAGARRFIASFGVDANKRLTISLKDLNPEGNSTIQFSDGKHLPLPIQDLPFVKL
ncbi:hypothetical protein TI05_13360 [Achromatium sp. WMS3]|nr:hypothetical protein TI05_13360 [Achromatium sp. WMS3]